MRIWTSTEGGADSAQEWTAGEATTAARRFDLILGLRWTFRAEDLTPIMRAANPKLRLLAYLNGSNSHPKLATTFPESAFAHDANNRRITNVHFGNFVMNVVSAEWRAAVLANAQSALAIMGTRSVYLDDMGAGNLGVNWSSIPIDPATGAAYTEATWVRDTSLLTLATKRALGTMGVFSNGLNSGTRYFGPSGTSRLLTAGDGAEAEAFVRGESAPVNVHRPEGKWLKDVEMLIDGAQRARIILAKTKLWVTSTPAEVLKWHRYAAGTFLLGTDGRHHLAFNSSGPGKPEPISALDKINLGLPLRPYARLAGVYRRDFAKGAVYVNPGLVPATAQTALGVNLDGHRGTELVLMPGTADIVRPVTP